MGVRLCSVVGLTAIQPETNGLAVLSAVFIFGYRVPAT